MAESAPGQISRSAPPPRQEQCKVTAQDGAAHRRVTTQTSLIKPARWVPERVLAHQRGSAGRNPDGGNPRAGSSRSGKCDRIYAYDFSSK